MTGNKKVIILILALSALTHFAFFGHPNETVFDEVHFGKFISSYLTGEYFFDVHPPLGKLLISGVGYLTGFKPGFSFANIGEVFPDRHYLWLRLLPTLAGTILPLIVFLLAQELGFSKRASFLAGLFTIFENALNIQSRFILLDAFLLLFGFSSLLFYFKYRHPESEPWKSPRGSTSKSLILAGIFAGLAASVKWTGLAFLGIILILELIRFSKSVLHPLESSRAESWGSRGGRMADLLKSFFGFILIPLAIYTSTFALHFYLLPKSGPGDAFMSPEFQKTLAGNMHQNNAQTGNFNFINKFIELNKQMYLANQRIATIHPYGSRWYGWPFISRSVFFWQDTTGPRQEKIYLLGNPLIWWAGTIAMFFLTIHGIKSLLHRKLLSKPGNFLLLGFFINLLPFIGISRVMFLYHYFPSLIFSFLTLAYGVNRTNKKSVFAFLTTIAVIGFLYFSPLTYGLPLSPQIQNYLFWFANWR